MIYAEFTESGHRYPVLQLAAVFVVICLLQWAISGAGFSDVSGDGFFRALMAYEWRSAPSLVTRDFGVFSLFWFPPYFWLTGTIYWLTDNLTVSLKMVSFISSTLGLLVLYRLSCLLTNRCAAIITVLLVGSIPFHLWLSLSMAETSLYLLLVLLGFVCVLHWVQRQQILYIPGTAIAFLGGSMLRPEGWILAGGFALYAVYLFINNRGRQRFWFVISGLVPMLFMAFWFADNWIHYGDPLYFINVQKAFVGGQHSPAPLDWSQALQPLFFMFALSPPVLGAIFLGLVFKWRAFTSGTGQYLMFVGLYLGALIILFLVGLGTTAAPQRYGLVPLVLLAPFAGKLLADGLVRPGRARAAALVFLLVCLGFHLHKSFNFPILYRDAVAAASYVRDLPRPNGIRRMATEFEIRAFAKQLPREDRDFWTLASEHGALLAYSGRPDGFLTRPLRLGTRNLPRTGTTPKEWRSDELLRDLLAANTVDAVFVRNRDWMEMLPPDFRLVRTFGRYAVLVRGGERVRPGRSDLSLASDGSTLAPGIRLAGHGYDGDLYPANLVLHWSFDQAPGPGCPYQVWVKAERRGHPEERLLKRFRPVFCWYDLNHGEPGDVVEDYLPLNLTKALPGGIYEVSIALAVLPGFAAGTAPESPPKDVTWLALPPVRLAFSRRAVLKNHLTGHSHDWSLLLHVLYDL